MLVVALVATTLAANPASATPTCSSAAADSDGDGWGWENGESCKVDTTGQAPDSQTPSQGNDPYTATKPECQNSYDPDGDGWGWENNTSCAHKPAAPTNIRLDQIRAPSAHPHWFMLRWDAVDGAAGYVVYLNGSPIGETTDTYLLAGRGTGNYFVKAYKPNRVAYSNPSRPVQGTGSGSVTPATDALPENGCRTGAPGQNNPVTDVTLSDPWRFELNGQQYFYLGIEFVGDCDARYHTLELGTGERYAPLIESFRVDSRVHRIEIPSNYLQEDVVYSIRTTSTFHDGDSNQGDKVFFVAPSAEALASARAIAGISAKQVTGNEVLLLAQKRELTQGSPSTSSVAVAAAGAVLTVYGIATSPTGLGLVVTLAGIGMMMHGFAEMGNGADLRREVETEFTAAVRQLLADEGLKQISVSRYRDRLMERFLQVGVANRGDLTTELAVQAIIDVVKTEDPLDWDRDGIPNSLDRTPGTKPVVVQCCGSDDGGGNNTVTITTTDTQTTNCQTQCLLTDGQEQCTTVCAVETVEPVIGLPTNKAVEYAPNGKPYCGSASSDPDGDGWGWENGASCVVRP